MHHVQGLWERYDFLSSGLGALACTGYCVHRGQDPIQALAITLAATISAVVFNEIFCQPSLDDDWQ